MKQLLERILNLQEVKRAIRQAQKDGDALLIDVRNLEGALGRTRRELEEVKQRRTDAQKEADARQLKIEMAEDQVQKHRVEMYQVASQRELDIIRKHIASNEADIEKWEDEGLVDLEQVDKLTARRDELAQRVQRQEQELQACRQEAEQGRARYEQEVQKLQEKKRQIQEPVDPQVLAAYEQIARQHHDDALAEVRNRVCQGCFTVLTKQTENVLQRQNEIVYCSTCGRMLVLAD